MTTRALIMLSLILTLAACGSRLNPFNWFGGDREERVEVEVAEVVVDPRNLVAEVSQLSVDQMPGGAIISAVGIPPVQGYWAADLVEGNRDGGTLTLEFRILEPVTATREGTSPSREVLAGVFLTDQQLQGITTIVVLGQLNRRSVRR
ncbi:MAG: hypothetical protein ACJAXT_001464 [Paracoccaceae bacterium]|jgi:hypothetical protein